MKFLVEGMSCGHCVAAITRAVQSLDESARVDVDLAAGTVAVAGGQAGSALDPAVVAAAIESEGYAVRDTVAHIAAEAPAPRCCGGCHG